MHQAIGTGKRKSSKRFSLLTFVLIGDAENAEMGSLSGVNRVENVEYVEGGWPWRTCRTWRINSEERQKAPLTFRLNAPQVSLTNKSEQVSRIDRFAV